jgi:hypothetical protein
MLQQCHDKALEAGGIDARQAYRQIIEDMYPGWFGVRVRDELIRRIAAREAKP